jgi:surfeit locus 1 family protein
MKKPPLIPAIIVLFFVILMTNMGFWQLKRAQEKVQMLELLADDHITEITEKSQIKDLPRYANIEIKGHYLNAPQLLLDNQIDKGEQGYHVFTPFVLDDLNMYLMINRGWIAKSKMDSDVLKVETEETQISGKLNTPPQVGIQLGEIELDKNKSQQVMTYFDKEKVSSFLHETLCQSLNCVVSQKILWLHKDQAQGFKRDWNPIVMLPSKHTAYAVQWFAMTFVLILIFLYWLKKQH